MLEESPQVKSNKLRGRLREGVNHWLPPLLLRGIFIMETLSKDSIHHLT